jgi:hypothetical protein
MDAGMIANQVMHVAHYADPDEADSTRAIIEAFRQCTGGLTDYERNQVASVLNFLLARPVF